MKPYGLPRRKDIEYPDVVDFQSFGLKCSRGKLREKGGDFKPFIRSTERKIKVRRYFKKQERSEAKLAIHQEIMEF